MVVEKHTDEVLKRGCPTGTATDRWSTTTNYYPRVMEYLVH